MKSFQLLIILVLMSLTFSCHKDPMVDEDALVQNAEISIRAKSDVAYPDLLLPNGLVQHYVKTGDKEPLQKWLNAKTTNLNKQCIKSDDCDEKLELMDQLLFLEWQKDIFGLDVETIDGLCDGLHSVENSGVDIIPSSKSLSKDEKFVFEYKIVTGESTCEGNVFWWSDNENIVTIDQNGEVTAIAEGTTYIHAQVENLIFLKGSAQITVEDDQEFDIVLVMGNGYGVEWLVGFQNGWPGVKQLASEITSSMSNHFGDNFKFGLVGFDHYPVLPWGTSLGGCRSVGNDVPEYEPLIGMSEYHLYLSLTDQESSMTSAMQNVKMMCTWHEWPANWNASPFSGVIKTIQNSNWRPDANRAIILLGAWPSTFSPSGAPDLNGKEGYSGYSINDIATIAQENDVKVFAINGWVDKSTKTNINLHALQEYRSIAEVTNGVFYEGPTNNLLVPINAMLDSIKNGY